ncbi:YKR005C [Saccharomyces arboricola H-6]|uniref:YKR005C n=1 Tax=Saccharomyces arboricola (strain H-6 / AS 2.3317 / CBS 10644) TaxID=1160507 RepID=J8Q5N8_SACAR|nr:YKR005C [Saccharomyces arboricola H-6]
MEDSNNCKCLQCALSSLNKSCFQDYCTSGDEYEKLQYFIKQFQSTNGVLDIGVSLKPKNNKFSSKKLTYFVDQNRTVFRNPLPFEKNQLISALLASITNTQSSKSPLGMATTKTGIAKRRRGNKKSLPRIPGDEDEGENDNDVVDEEEREDEEYHETNEDNYGSCGEICDKNNNQDVDDDDSEIHTNHLSSYATTEIDTTYPSKKGKGKGTTWKPGEISTSYLMNERQGTRTITTTNIFFETETERETHTETEIETHTKTTLLTLTKAKRRWFPRTTTITSTATTTSLSTTSLLITVTNQGRFKKITGIKLGLFNVSDEAVLPRDERNALSVIKRNAVSDPDTASHQNNLISKTTPQVPSQPELSSGQYISAASQLDKRIFIFTAITVSITTLMMLGFSYRSRVSFRDYSINESNDDDDGDWSDEVELDEEDFYSLPISIPEKGLSLDKMAQQLSVE